MTMQIRHKCVSVVGVPQIVTLVLLLIMSLQSVDSLADNSAQSSEETRYHYLDPPTTDFADWSLQNGEFEISKGWVFVKSHTSNPQIIIPTKIEGDLDFQATLRNIEGFHWAGLLAKGIFRLIVNNESGRLELQKREGTAWKTAAYAENYQLYVRKNESFRMRLVFAGESLSAYIDDKKLITYQNQTPVADDHRYGLISGWKTNIAWGDIAFKKHSTDISVLQAHQQHSVNNRFVEVVKVRGFRDDNIYYDGEEAGFFFRVKYKAPIRNSITIKLILVDIREQEVARKEIVEAFLPQEKVDLKVTFEPERRGCFKVVLYVDDTKGNSGWVEDLGSFTVLPKLDSNVDVLSSYFGGHIDGIDAAWHLKVVNKLGIKWLRAHDGVQTAWWTRVQPDGPDQWLWPYDNVRDLITKGGGMSLGVFLWTPRWAATGNSEDGNHKALPPTDWQAFERFVRKVVAHNQTGIQHWEVWNEPHYRGYWQGSPEQYAKLLKEAYRAIHEIDADAFVLGAGGVSAKKLQWIERMLKAGAGEYMDGFSIHYLDPDNAEQDMIALRSLMKKYSVNVPVWNTEASVPSTSFLDQLRGEDIEQNAPYHFRNACFELVRMYMENISNGVERVFYYHQFDPWRFKEYNKPRAEGGGITTGMLDEGKMLKPIAAAHAALVFAIQGMRYRASLKFGDIRAYIFEGGGRATAVLYAECESYTEERTYRLFVPEGDVVNGFNIIDFMGNESILSPTSGKDIAITISREPRYLVYRGKEAGAYLETLLNKTF